MQMKRSRRAMLGAACLVAVALAMGWFVGRYIPGEPRAPEPPVGEGLYSETGYIASRIVDFEPGTALRLRGVTQGVAYSGRPDEVAEHIPPNVAEEWKRSGLWEYDIPDFDISVRGVKTVPTMSFADWYPEYKSSYRAVYEDSKILAVDATITNASSEVLDLQRYSLLGTASLWGEGLAGVDDSLGAGAHLDNAYYFANEGLRSEGWLVQPGESQQVVLPFKVNANNLKDPAAFDRLDPSAFCLQIVDYDSGTAYRLWL